MPKSTPEEPQAEETTQATYSAKQVASRIGAHPKQLRKFFRSSASTIEPVGRGSRYEFPVDELETIREQFHKWRVENQARLEAGKFKRRSNGAQAVVDEEEIEEFIEDDEEED